MTISDSVVDSESNPEEPVQPPDHSEASSFGNTELSAEASAALAAADLAAGRRRWPLFVLGVAIGAAATWAALNYVEGDDGAAEPGAEAVVLSTASVAVGDLLEEVEWTGTLGYGDPVDLAGPGGVVTSAAPDGATLERGSVIATVDNEPVVALFGDTPMWRNLSEGSEGIDVLQLEANLAALGYDPDQTVDIDQTFTANTEAMVERWQTDLGAEVTGIVSLGSVIIIEGPALVTGAAEVGAAASGTLATLTPRSAVSDVVARIDGVIGSPAAVGTSIEHGTVLFTIDDEPVVALLKSDSTSEDGVGGALIEATPTVGELEQALVDAGFDPDGEMTVDEVATEATAAAIERWQAAVGLPVTGLSDPGYYVAVPPGRQVAELLVEDGASVVTGGPVLTATASRLVIQAVVDVADSDEFEVGQEVTIELADETVNDGVVSAVGSVIPPANQQGTPTVEVLFEMFTEPGQDVVEGAVTIVSIGEEIRGATVIPTRGLITLNEGGFAVEKVLSDGSTQLVAVELGAFDDGIVEVTAGDVTPGDEIVVPR